MHSRLPRSVLICASLVAALGATGCSSGGEEDRPSSNVKIASEQFLFGLVARPEFADFPTTTNDITTVDARMSVRDDGTYRLVTSTGSLLSEGDYFLDEDGAFSITVPTTTQTLLYRGGYGLAGETGDLFLTDRIGDGIGLYFGSERVTGTPNRDGMVGDWHVFTMHALMPPGSPPPSRNLVAHSFGGTMTIASDGSFSGSGTASDSANVTLRGDPNDFQAFADGRFVVELLYDRAGAPDVERGFQCGGNTRVVFGVDTDEGGTDDAAGLIAMIRHRSSAYAAADLEGTFHFGLWTLFPQPDASGNQAAIGTLELTRDGNFVIEARDAGVPGGRDPIDFDYRGTWTATAIGGLTLNVTDTGETWVGAFDDGYETIVLLDPVMVSTNNIIELNLGVGLRQVAPR